MNALRKIVSDQSLSSFHTSESGSSFIVNETGGLAVFGRTAASENAEDQRDAEATHLLRKFRRADLPTPKVFTLEGEINFLWKQGDLEAHGSVEGNGQFGYAMKVDGKFVPGNGPEEVYWPSIPVDLFDYLSKFSQG